MASSLNSLETYYGRPDIKVLEITQDKDSSYKRLFYRSTGSGNEKFMNIFSDTLVPFYHHIEDETDKPSPERSCFRECSSLLCLCLCL